MAQSDLHHQTLKHLLKSFSQSELFVIEEVAHYLKVSEKYVLNAIKTGELKAFKVDEHWFIEEKWLAEYKNQLKVQVVKESTDNQLLKHQSRNWIRKIEKPEKRENFFGLKPWEWFVYPLGLAFATFSLACFMIPLLEVYGQKQEVAVIFLKQVDLVYSVPADLLPAKNIIQSEIAFIDDEVLTRKLNIFIQRFWQSGQVAGAFEKNADYVNHLILGLRVQ
jgi:excisionase family DNA binding protein